MADLFSKITAHAKEYGFVFPSSEIYGNLGAVYDYGPNGVELRNNLKNYWWQAMVQMHENIVGIDAAIFMHPKTWKASGHVDAFNDPLIDNKDSKKRYRADVLVEEHIEKIKQKIEKEVAKGQKRFGDAFDEKQFRATHPNIIRRKTQITDIEARLKTVLETEDWHEFHQLIMDLGIVDPVSGSTNWTAVRQFNLMFTTQLGNIAGAEGLLYLRPETAQGIFLNFLNVMKSSRQKIPFGIAQTGKAFRNEIVARQFIFRMREFEQMEMQFFVPPGKGRKWYDYWKEKRLNWHKAMGLGDEKYRFHDHLKPAHYADAACDIEFDFPFGFKELEGIHSRTDFDLFSHQQLSGKKLQYFDPVLNKNYIPHVVETSIGLDRLFLATLSAGYHEEKIADNTRIVLKIPPALAPVKVAVLPLLKKDDLPEKALHIFNALKIHHNCYYEEKDAIGRRYRRQDAIGTPFCITIDHQTLEDDTVTLRERDSMEQHRIPAQKVVDVANEKLQLRDMLLKC